MKVKFRISSAGVAGDPNKILCGVTKEGIEFRELFNSKSLWSLRRAKKRILKRLELYTGRKHVEEI